MTSSDPKSYRATTLHLTDIIPPENTLEGVGAGEGATINSLSNEKQRLQEAFIAKAQEELKKKNEKTSQEIISKKVNQNQVEREWEQEKKNTSTQQEVDNNTKQSSKNVTHIDNTLTVNNSSIITPNHTEIKQEKDPREGGINVNVTTKNRETEEKIEEPPPEKPTSDMTKKDPVQMGEKLSEKENIDYGGEEISQLFERYAKELQQEKENEVVIKGQDTVTTTPFIQEPLDIWEMDTQKTKAVMAKNVQKKQEDASLKSSSQENIEKDIEKILEKTEATQKETTQTQSRLLFDTNQATPQTLTPNLQTPTIAPKEKETVFKEEKQTPHILQRVAYATREDLLPKKSVAEKPVTQNEKTGKTEHEDNLDLENKNTSVFKNIPLKDILDQENISKIVETKNLTTSQGSDLAKLRERIVKEHQNEKNTDTQQNLEEEHQTLSSTIAQKIQTIESNQRQENDVQRPKPQSKHAQILSDVADRLHNLTTEEGRQTVIQNSIKKQSLEEKIEENTINKTETPLAPGEIQEKEYIHPSETQISPIRTFKQDVEDSVIKNKTSVVGMISAEENRKPVVTATIRTAPKPIAPTFSRVLFGAIIILIVGAITIIAFLVFKYTISTNKSENVSTLSSIAKTIPYIITDQSREEILNGLVHVRDITHFNTGSIIEIELNERIIGSSSGDNDIFTTKSEPSAFLEKVGTNAPDSLVRSIKNISILGLHELNPNKMFLLFKVDNHNVAFRGMFDWEKNMYADLTPLFGDPIIKNTPTQTLQQTNTATGTLETSQQQILLNEDVQFEDLYIANKEVRGFRNSQGTLVLLWAMPNDDTVIITASKVTMEIILERLANQANAN